MYAVRDRCVIVHSTKSGSRAGRRVSQRAAARWRARALARGLSAGLACFAYCRARPSPEAKIVSRGWRAPRVPPGSGASGSQRGALLYLRAGGGGGDPCARTLGVVALHVPRLPMGCRRSRRGPRLRQRAARHGDARDDNTAAVVVVVVVVVAVVVVVVVVGLALGVHVCVAVSWV